MGGESGEDRQIGPHAAVREDEPADAEVSELADEPSSVGEPARCHGNAASARGAGRARPRASRRRPRGPGQGRGIVASPSTAPTRVAPAAKARRILSAASRPPATWIGIAMRAAIGPRPRDCPAGRSARPSKSTRWMTRRSPLDEALGDPSGRSVGAPTPVEAPGQKTRRERPRSRSIEGMTCTSGAGGPVGARGRRPGVAPSSRPSRRRCSRGGGDGS